MKTALIAIDPMNLKGQSFERFCANIRLFQKRGLFSRTSIASVTHGAQYLMPYEFYRKHKEELVDEAKRNVQRACAGKFPHEAVRALQSDSSANEELVALLCRHGKKLGSDLLVVSSNDRKGLPYWFLGSLAETASLSATMPVLIFKGAKSPPTASRTSDLVVSIDVSAAPSARDLTWLANLSRSTQSRLSLVYVEPRRRAVADLLRERKAKTEALHALRKIASSLQAKGAAGISIDVLPEGRSIAHTIVDFVERKKSWMTIVTTPKRTKLRKLLLGSNARHLLALSKGPFLSLRLE